MEKSKKLTFKFLVPATVKSEKASGEDIFYLEGYAATNDLDRENEIITKEALLKGVDDLLSSNTVFYEHRSQDFPIGKVVEAKLIEADGSGDSDKLYVKVYISQTADKVRTLIKEGILKKFSIGGEVLKKEEVEDKATGKKVVRILDMILYEVSVVGLPANPHASVIDYSEGKSLSYQLFKSLRKNSDDEIPELKNEGGKKMALEDKDEAKKDIEVKEEKVEKAEVSEEVKETPEAEDKIEKSEDVVDEESKEENIEKTEAEKPSEEKEEPKVEDKIEKDVETPKEEISKEKEAEDNTDKQEDMEGEEEGEEYIEIKDIVEAITAAKNEILAAINAISEAKEASDEAKEPEVKEDSIKDVVTKVIDEKLGKLKIVNSRKGKIIREDTERVEKNTDSEVKKTALDIVNNQEDFDKLPEEEKKKAVKEGFLGLLKQKGIN